jgi:hypothetical protein
VRSYHSRRVKHRSFKEGDLVLRLVQKNKHKLAPTWEGPFAISKVLNNGSYYLIDLRDQNKMKKKKGKKRKHDNSSSDEKYGETDRPWNITQLRPFYS